MDTGSVAPTKKRTEKKKRGKRRTRRRARDHRPKARNHQIQEALLSATQKTYEELFGPRTDLARPFELELKMLIEPGAVWKLETEPSIEAQIRAAVKEMAIQTEAYRSGRVYCYRCESSLCPHGLPPEPGSIFRRYSSTGVPLWLDFAQALLEMKHPDVDLLYRPNEKTVLAAYMSPEMLKHRQLDVFGRQSKTYDILGQVVFGYVPVTAVDAETRRRERVAFTLQAVECRKPDGSPRLELNVLGRLSNGDSAMDSFEGPFQRRIHNITVSTRNRIRSLTPSKGPPGRGRPARLRANTSSLVTETLRKSMKTLEKADRQRVRRTTHAGEHRVSHRPTSTALEDTLSATDDLFLWDEHRNTVVVVGPRNRVHVFSPEGRHITSLILEADAVKSRMRRKRWTQMPDPTLRRFRMMLNRTPP